MANCLYCFIFVLYILLTFCASITNLVLGILYYLEVKLGSDFYDFPLNNWKSEIVIDFEIGINCSGENIFHYTWPGTVTGCRCSSGGYKRGSCCVDSSKRKCSTTGSNCKGSTISVKGSKSGQLWEFYDTSVQICAQRIPNYSLFSQTPRSSGCNNPADMKCGSGEYMFCIPRSFGKCPIRSMMIGDSLDSSLALRYEEKLQITTNKTLYFSRNDNKVFPVAQFRVKQGVNICLRNSQSIGTPGRTHYFLLDYDTSPSCYQDLRFQSISNLGEKRLFYLNKIDDIIKDLPPVYQVDDQYQYFNFYNNYGRLKLECRQSLQEIFDNTKILEDIETLSLAILILSSLYVAHYFFFDFWSGLTQGLGTMDTNTPLHGNVLCVSSWEKSSISTGWTSIYIYQFFVFLKYGILFSFFVVICYEKSMIDQELNFLNDLKEKSCSDEYFDEIISQVLGSISSTYVDAILGLLVPILAFDPTLMYLLRNLFNQIYDPNSIGKNQVQIFDINSTVKIQSNSNHNNSQQAITKNPSNIEDEIGPYGSEDGPLKSQTAAPSFINNRIDLPNSTYNPNINPNIYNHENVVPIQITPIVSYPATNTFTGTHPQPTVNVVNIINPNQASGPFALYNNQPN